MAGRCLYGEAVFTTGMTGYPESLDCPIPMQVAPDFTYPLIGNYGVPTSEHWESEKIHAMGVVVSQNCIDWSHHQGAMALDEWLRAQKIPLILGVDTRALTKLLRTSGTMAAAIAKKTISSLRFPKMAHRHWVAEVSSPEMKCYGQGKKKT